MNDTETRREGEGMTRDRMINATVTLNGSPAVVTGKREGFATVAALDSGESFQWSWQAVERIIGRGGDFRS